MKTIVYSPAAMNDLRGFTVSERRGISKAVEAIASGDHGYPVEIAGAFRFALAPAATIGFAESEEVFVVFALGGR